MKFVSLKSKKLSVVLFCMLFAFTSFAQNVGIIPTPQKVDMKTGHYQFVGSPVVESLMVTTLPISINADQGYTLEVTPQKVVIRATTETGLFYAQMSLKQMVDYYTKDSLCTLPCMLITDYPAMKYRGWMDDISRGPIPTMDFIKRVISTMAQYKMNFFNLYTEHVFKLDNYPDVAPTDGLTAAEIKELEAYAAQYHVEFFGNQQCLAHAEKTLRIPFYQDMADTKANWNPGTPKTYEFLDYQLKTVAEAYSSPFFNIDCDETEALGNGKAKDFVNKVGSASQVYADHVNHVYNVLKPLGKRVMMWGDIAAKDSAITAQLPKDMLMIVWSYAPQDSYESMIHPFTKQGLEFMVAPGMSMWSTVYPSYFTYTKNIANLVRDGYKNGALGMMNTAWDDSGESLFNSTWHGMTWAAEMSWKPVKETEVEKADVERTERLRTFDSLFNRTFVQAFGQDKEMSRLENFDSPNFFQSASLYESLFDFYPNKVEEKYFVINESIASRMEKNLLQYDFNKLKDTDPNAPQYLAPMRFAHYIYQRQKTVAKRNALRFKLYQYYLGNNKFSKADIERDLENLLKDLHQTKKEYMKIWDEESRSYSRDIVEGRFDRTAQEILNVPNHVFIESEQNENGEAVVTLKTLFGDKDIYYTTDGLTPQIGENLYSKPFTMSQSGMVQALTINAMNEPVITKRYVLLHKAMGKLLRLNSEYSDYRPQYAASGPTALADGIVGGELYSDGTWQGFWGNDISVDFDFGKTTELNYFKSRFIQNIYDWIMSPNTVEIYVSKNGHDFTLHKTLTLDNVDYNSSAKGIFTLTANDLNIKARYVRVVVKNGGPLPHWHQATGQPSYIFCDEIILN